MAVNAFPPPPSPRALVIRALRESLKFSATSVRDLIADLEMGEVGAMDWLQERVVNPLANRLGAAGELPGGANDYEAIRRRRRRKGAPR